MRLCTMPKWTKESSISELTLLINEVDSLTGVRRHSAPHTRWLARTLKFLEQVFGAASTYYLSLVSIPWSRTGTFIVPGSDLGRGFERAHQEAYVNQLDSAKGLLQAALDELQVSELTEVYVGKDTGPESSAIFRLINLLEHKLRKVIRTEPKREKEVQEAVENLLIGADLEYSRETEAIEYSSKTYTPDFTLTRLDLALEIKLCGREGREAEIIAEINDDILAYSTKYGNLLFTVYDVGLIRDVERFINCFEKHEGVVVRVVKH